MHWLAFFYLGNEGDVGTSVCPNCGAHLNIKQLR
jgi:hypothetical protein